MKKEEDIYLSSNIRFLRVQQGKTQDDVAKVCNKTNTAVSNWEKGIREPDSVDLANIAMLFDVSVDDLMLKDLRFDNGTVIEIPTDVETIKVPVLGIIKAGSPIEAQENILDYVEIPKDWTKGGKKFYGLKISGDSMYPKYLPNDTVVFEQTEDMEYANNKDACVMVNGFDATFKKFNVNQNGITLTPLNMENEDGYLPTFYSIEQIQDLPVKVIGIAKKIERNV